MKINFKRKTGYRDAKLIVIATEGIKTEVIYFEDLKEKYKNLKVHTEVIKKKDTKSSPEYILDSLIEFKNTYKLNVNDELWLVIDFDKWGTKKISSISTSCRQKRIHLALSNPCFELWLLLHFIDVSSMIVDEKNKIKNNKKINRSRNFISNLILKYAGEYNKSNIKSELFFPTIYKAINRAEKLDINQSEPWPTELGTRVYLLVKSILNK